MAKILVIEDNEDIRANICEILELADYNVLGASNGKRGVELAIQSEPDLIICDIMMPSLDGFGVLKILSKHKDAFRIPFIFLTSKSEKQDLRKGMGLGASDFITKPFDDTELLEVIETRIKLSRRSKSLSTGSHNFSLEKTIEVIEANFLKTEKIKVGPGHSIIEQSRKPNYVYWISDGLIKTQMSNSLGKVIIIDISGPRELLGYEYSWLEGSYQYEAIILQPSEIFQMPKSEFKKLIESDLSRSEFVMQYIMKKKMSNDLRLMEMAYGTLREKLANALLFVATKFHGTPLRNDCFIRMRRDDLASLTGSAVESTIRTLAEFKSVNIISISKEEIQLLDIVELQKIGLRKFFE